MLIAAYIVGFSGMLLLPILLGFYLTRKFKLSWKLLLAGALTFIASQVLHIPLVVGLTAAFTNGALPAVPEVWSLLFNAVLLGLLAGIFEETARYILFKFILKDARSWNEAVTVGAGHGGIEAIATGVLAIMTLVSMIAYRSMDLSTVPSIPPEQLELAKQQVQAYWSAPVYMAFLGLAERVFAICLHLTLSAMVLYAIAARKPIWFWLALLWHAVVDGVAVYLGQGQILGAVALEGVVGLMAALSLVVLFVLRGRFPASLAPETKS